MTPSNASTLHRRALAARLTRASLRRDVKVLCGTLTHAEVAGGAHPSTLIIPRPEERRPVASTSSPHARARSSSSRTLVRASVPARARERDPVRGDEDRAHPRTRIVESTRAASHDLDTLDTQPRGSWSRRASTSSVYRATLAASCSDRRHSSAFLRNGRGTPAHRARRASLVVGGALDSPRLADGFTTSDAPEVDQATDRRAAVILASPRDHLTRSAWCGPRGRDDASRHTGRHPSRLTRSTGSDALSVEREGARRPPHFGSCLLHDSRRRANEKRAVLSRHRRTPPGMARRWRWEAYGSSAAFLRATPQRHPRRRARHASGQGPMTRPGVVPGAAPPPGSIGRSHNPDAPTKRALP